MAPKSGAGNRRPFQGPCRPTPNVQRTPHETQKNKNELPQRNRDLQKKVMRVDRSSSACQQHTATVDAHVSKGSAFTALAVEEAVARGDAASPNASRTKHDARSSSRGASAPTTAHRARCATLLANPARLWHAVRMDGARCPAPPAHVSPTPKSANIPSTIRSPMPFVALERLPSTWSSCTA